MPVTELDLSTYTKQLADIAAALKSPVPTPPVGTSIVWLDRNSKQDEYHRAAIVTQIEAPGKIKCVVFSPDSMARHRKGVFHTSHETHKIPGNPVTVNNGAWAYPNGVQPHKDHFTYHLDLLKSRQEQVTRDMEEYKRAFGPKE